MTSKTPRAIALGVFVFLAGWNLSASVSAHCPLRNADETARLAYVLDGDTLQLTNGKRVRVLGINTPETKKADKPEESGADAARSAVRAFFKSSKVVYLSYATQRKDRYGRVLAHVYNHERNNLGAFLLASGLAFQAVVPPNLSELDCLKAEEQRARLKKAGLWSDPYWDLKSSTRLRSVDAGFFRVSGKIQKVTVGKDIWLELKGLLVVKIAAKDKRYFGDTKWEKWRGKTIELRGWIKNRSSERAASKDFKPLVMQVRHPSMIGKMPR